MSLAVPLAEADIEEGKQAAEEARGNDPEADSRFFPKFRQPRQRAMDIRDVVVAQDEGDCHDLKDDGGHKVGPGALDARTPGGVGWLR